MKNNGITTLIVPAAGAGTRLFPLTLMTPKEALRLVDKPAIHYIATEAHQSGIRNIVFVINPWKRAIKRYFSPKYNPKIVKEFPKMNFLFLETKDMFGDGHAIFLARKFIKKNSFFAVSMADLLSPPGKPFLKQLIDEHNRCGHSVISVERVPKDHVDRYGIIDPFHSYGTVHVVKDIIEKPPIGKAPSNCAMTGKYILPYDIFNYLSILLKKRDSLKEVRLADALKEYVKENELYALECDGKHFDVGNKLGFLKTELFFLLKDKNFRKEIRDFLKSILTN